MHLRGLHAGETAHLLEVLLLGLALRGAHGILRRRPRAEASRQLALRLLLPWVVQLRLRLIATSRARGRAAPGRGQ